jgi:hypothetical protein
MACKIPVELGYHASRCAGPDASPGRSELVSILVKARNDLFARNFTDGDCPLQNLLGAYEHAAHVGPKVLLCETHSGPRVTQCPIDYFASYPAATSSAIAVPTSAVPA